MTPFTQMENDRIVINLLIGNQTHQLTVTREMEPFFREAAELINDRYNKYRQSYQNQDINKYNAVVMLDIAVRYLKNKDNQDTQPFMDSILQLTEEVETALGEKS